MANWRRGFFRLWVVVAVLWVVIIGIFVVPSYLNPYVGNLYFTLDDKGQPETLVLGTDRFGKVFGDTTNGYYQRASFGDLAPNVTYFAPNIMEVEVRGKKYQARVTTPNTLPEGRPGLVDALTNYILLQDPSLDRTEIHAEVDQAIPEKFKPKYMTKEVVAEAKDYAILLRRNALAAAQQNAFWPMILSLIAPPIILLILGSALAWVLTGFRRTAQ